MSDDHARIDVHQHVLPPAYLTWLNDKGVGAAGGLPLPSWSADGALAMMDTHGIATGVLSVSTPGTTPAADATDAATIARTANEYVAELAKDRPDRFGNFATLTLPYVDAALGEAAYALDDLGADGVVLLANSDGVYLGDPSFDPLMAELNRRRAVVFVHPAALPGPNVDGIPPFVVDFLLDTTRAAINLVRNGVTTRYPDISFILSHGGGFVPYASHRIAATLSGVTGAAPADILAELRRFSFDTALTGSPAALPSLLAFAEPGHVLYGSDWPYATDAAVAYFTGKLDAYPELPAEIDNAAAKRLFTRLA